MRTFAIIASLFAVCAVVAALLPDAPSSLALVCAVVAVAVAILSHHEK